MSARKFKIEQTNEILTPHGGLPLIGHCLNHHTSLNKTARSIVKRHGIPTIDLIRTYLGLICLGKSDFEAVEGVRHDRFFKAAMCIGHAPSAARLRQRFDQDAQALIPLLDAGSVEFMEQLNVPVTALETGHIPLDIDVFPMDNSNSKKEGVSWTYKKYDGYAPIAAYLGKEGWCLGCELRPGSQHANREFHYVLERILPRARRLTHHPILLRLDSAHDSKDNQAFLRKQRVDYLIKWNPRGHSPERWLEKVPENAHWETPRDGKQQIIFSHYENGQRRVIELTIRYSNTQGQRYLLPEIKGQGWNTSLTEQQADDQTIIALYRDHATSEQYHSEFKTDLDLERLPSGKFDSNDLVLSFAVLSYNLLRWVGLNGLHGQDAPVRHPAKRRRLRTVMQELIYLACKLTRHGRQTILKYGQYCTGYRAFRRVYNSR